MLNNRIKELRASKGLTQKQLAELMNVTQQAVAKWEKGVSEPDISTFALLAHHFEVTTDYLLGRTEKKEKPAPQGDEFTIQEHALILAYRAASPDDRAIIDNIVGRYTHAPSTSRLA